MFEEPNSVLILLLQTNKEVQVLLIFSESKITNDLKYHLYICLEKLEKLSISPFKYSKDDLFHVNPEYFRPNKLLYLQDRISFHQLITIKSSPIFFLNWDFLKFYSCLLRSYFNKIIILSILKLSIMSIIDIVTHTQTP